jgi:hypothetical protein
LVREGKEGQKFVFRIHRGGVAHSGVEVSCDDILYNLTSEAMFKPLAQVTKPAKIYSHIIGAML